MYLNSLKMYINNLYLTKTNYMMVYNGKKYINIKIGTLEIPEILIHSLCIADSLPVSWQFK